MGQSPSQGDVPSADEVMILDILLVLVRGRWLIAKIVLAFALLGMVIAVIPSAEYSSEAEVAPEGQNTSDLRVSSLQQLGINVGGSQEGLGPAAYPNLLTGRNVQLRVVRDTLRVAHLDTSYVLADYLTRPKGILEKTVDVVSRYTVGLPRQILEAFEEDPPPRTLSTSTAEDGETDVGGQEVQVYPTAQEERAMSLLESMYSVSRGSETGFITIRATSKDPHLSSQIVERLIHHFRDRVSAIRTKKAKENLAFIEDQFTQAEQELERAETRLANFLDRNTGLQTAKLETERARLERQVRFKENLYDRLQSQRAQAQVELQRSEPVITVVEDPVPPLSPSGPNRVMYLLAFVALGTMVGIGFVFVRTFLSNQMKHSEDAREKVQELKEALLPRRFWNGRTDPIEWTSSEEAREEPS